MEMFANKNTLVIAGILLVIVLAAVVGLFLYQAGRDQGGAIPDGAAELARVEAERIRLENSLSQTPGIVGGGYEKMMDEVGTKIRAIEAAYPEMKDFTATSGQYIEREAGEGIHYFAFVVRKPQGSGFSKATCFSVDDGGAVVKTGELGSEIGDAQAIGPRTCKALGHLDLGA
jgi:hypothetical protein